MSTESLPGRKHRRIDARWRGPVGLMVSIALHAGLGAILALFVASSEPERGIGAPVPISFVSRNARNVAATDTTGQQKPSVTLPRDVKAVARNVTSRPGLKAPVSPSVTPTSPPVGALEPEAGPAPASASGDLTATNIVDPGDSTTGAAGTSGFGNGESDGGPVIETQGTRASGGTTEATQMDNEADRQYAMHVRRMLERRGAYPSTARKLGLEGLVKMLIRIDGSGMVFDKRVLVSSGFPQLDHAALTSADRIGTLPPPPGGRPVDIMIPVRFSMLRN